MYICTYVQEPASCRHVQPYLDEMHNQYPVVISCDMHNPYHIVMGNLNLVVMHYIYHVVMHNLYLAVANTISLKLILIMP